MWWDYTTISDSIDDGTLEGAWVTPYIIDPNDNMTLYVGYEDVWKTTDRGDSFTMIGDFSDGNLHSMAIAPFLAVYCVDPNLLQSKVHLFSLHSIYNMRVGCYFRRYKI